MADLTKTIALVFQGQDTLSPVIANLQRQLDALGAAGRVPPPTNVPGVPTPETFARTGQSATQLVGILQTLASSIVVKEFIDANVAVENFGRAMTIVTGSSVAAADSFQYVKDISNTLGLEITGAANNFVALSAAAKGTALEGQATRDIFEAISKSMSLLGKSSAETNGALLAVQQIISKGTVSSEELRGQLGERLPGAFQIAARAVGVTTQELGKLLEGGKVIAEEFLPKFAAELNKTFGDTTYVNSFNAEFNRLTNTLKELAVVGGDAGLFGGLTQALIGLKDKTEASAKELKLLSDTFNAFRTFALTGDVEQLGRKLEIAGDAFTASSGKIDIANQSLAETSRLTRLNQDAITAYADQSQAETERLVRQESTWNDALIATNQILKSLGVDPKKLIDPFFDAQKAFADLVALGEAGALTLYTAFSKGLGTSKTLADINELGSALTTAFIDGKIGPELFAKSIEQLGAAQAKIIDPTNKASEAIKKQADETKKAEENAAKMALELEKLASNERIKAMEFSVTLKVADIEATTKRVEAAFTSIDNTIKVTTENTSKLFELFASSAGFLTGSQLREITDQIAVENNLRERAFQLQQQLTQAQIEALKAQTRNLDRGDALIKIDGAGLQPHLEAFMWEILKTIQVRVNNDGLAMLLGIP